jgi:hypothetical protein
VHRRWLGATCLLVAACAAVAPHAPAPAPVLEAPAGFPSAFYRQTAASGRAVYQIDAGRSIATVNAYASGSLAHLGHNHVISTRQIHGFVLASDDPQEARADLYVSLAGLDVDDPPLRAAAGFDGPLKPEEIVQTRAHMLDAVLRANLYPFLELRAAWTADAPPGTALDVHIRLHGTERPYRVPVKYSRTADSLEVSGQFQIRQTDFAMTPYSVLGGALMVRDELVLRFTILARRTGGG